MSEIKLVQAPIIKHDLYTVGANVTARIKDLNIEGQVATEETVGALKKLRAELNKEFAEFEAQRKAIKESVTNPYSELELIYKSEVSDKYKSATETLKDKIAEVEDRIKSNTLEEVKSFFVELCLSENIDFISYNQTGIEIKLSDSVKSYKDRVTAFVSKVVDELNLINTQENKAEILVEYKKTLNAAKAIKDIQDRKQAEKTEKERIYFAEQNRRKTVLLAHAMTYNSITKTHDFNSNIYINDSLVSNGTDDEFKTAILEAEVKIKAIKAKDDSEIKVNEEIIKTPTEPLKAPVIIETEETFVAKFECIITRKQGLELKEFFTINNITYKNI